MTESLRSIGIHVFSTIDTGSLIHANSLMDDFSDLSRTAIDDIADLDSGMDSFSGTVSNAGRFVQDHWKEIGLAGAAAGAGLEAMIRSQSDLSAATNRLGVTTEMTADEVRGLTSAMSDYTFSEADVLAGMERLTQSNIRTKEEMEALLPVFDLFADATGKDIVQGIDLFDNALSALGIPLNEAEQHMDALAWLTTQTTVSTQQIGQTMRREASAIQDLGLSVDDVAIALSSLEAEGIKGPQAVQAFQGAISDANGDIQDFYHELGVSAETLDAQANSLMKAEGLTGALADANNDVITPMQKLQSQAEILMYNYGDLIGAAGALTPILMGLGPAIQLVTIAKSGLALAAGAVSAPILLTVGAVALLAGGITYLWKTNEGFRDGVIDAWDTVTGGIGTAIDWTGDKINWLQDRFYGVLDFFENFSLREVGSNIMQGLIGGITDKIADLKSAVTNVGSTIRDGVTGFFGINSPSKLMMEYGGNIGQGLEVGMIDTMPELNHTFNELTMPDIEPAFLERPVSHPASRESRGGNHNVTFNNEFNFTVNGADERAADELMDRVRRDIVSIMEDYWELMNVKQLGGAI
ncbi:hypothetical protein SYNTR_0709 [Candidatus Syntrophocurvum alkaliphilum]|uniref:Phage tail tape measure protein domain-containing protein n=1 Tax=Candidatus Syntrophocurvum alkaliphilum TaxID=2293317 RepID=A0A6I6DE36_9FIRM|nr:phage tail tape measure protein [Candidatus Syntrophocurvum alkaliphilum]QGT99302.1 hypothetical protein SYNTR_0709 [Candidatus Syntrophocurvum alkaliphilum]